MSLFEALYGRRCWTLFNWSEFGERAFIGLDLVKEAEEHVLTIRQHLLTAQSRQKRYADRRWRELEFKIEDFVYIKVSPLRGMQRFQMKGKLAPRYVGPFWIIGRYGKVDYQLELPPSLSTIHDVFHISQLKKCLWVPTKVIEAATEELQPDLSYCEHPIYILDEAEWKMWRKCIKFLKVQWSNHSEDEATWEREDQFRANYPEFFSNLWVLQ